MYSIRLIIDRLQKHPFPGTKDSVGANGKGKVKLQQQNIDPLLIVEANWIID
jgi:hypothetical protein